MEPVSRRTFFKRAGAVAVVAGGVAVTPMGLGGALAGASQVKDAPLAPEEELHSTEELIAHVKNTKSGEISLFVGQREVTIHDRTMAARLVRATRK